MLGLRILGGALVVSAATAVSLSARDVPADTLPADLAAEAPMGFERVEFEAPGYTELQVALGRRLFFDPILSVDRSVACASCHQPEFGFADPRALSVGLAPSV